ncbi:hypothetical protein [Vibrio coralliilyticus]|uniref:hypothetical protein n=1 Tax=Vibrio coralliilyticus TaxID=190893 RepID=UPI00148C4AC9|nr:hypothetical protein [Vibrio coralliilyticus]NOI32211.1 hypothetical protein [Vibrio coralliilyticus]NOI51384.1 hypothetical protein [Vibrio coralliilyticus]
MGIFDLFKRKNTVNGVINYLRLDSWWLNELNSAERDEILQTYPDSSLVEGKIYSTNQTQLHLLWSLAGWFNKPGKRELAYKILAKAESLINEHSDPLDLHFLYGAKLEVCYKDRDIRADGIQRAIEACEQQIDISHKAATAFINKFGGALPSHKGYRQLAIILEKQKRYKEAASLCLVAKEQGWSGDWEKRIARCDNKAINAC